jgi:hypothetical protein
VTLTGVTVRALIAGLCVAAALRELAERARS